MVKIRLKTEILPGQFEILIEKLNDLMRNVSRRIPVQKIMNKFIVKI
jgi:hypothetical protein